MILRKPRIVPTYKIALPCDHCGMRVTLVDFHLEARGASRYTQGWFGDDQVRLCKKCVEKLLATFNVEEETNERGNQIAKGKVVATGKRPDLVIEEEPRWRGAKVESERLSFNYTAEQLHIAKLEEAVKELVKLFESLPSDDGFSPGHYGGYQHPYGGECGCGVKGWGDRREAVMRRLTELKI